jgi:hypothetical protein
MKKIYIAVLLLTFIKYCYSQTNELNFNFQRIDFSAAPRTAINPMSIKLWDSYNNGGPTSYGTVLELYGLGGHQTSQLNFGGWDNSKIRYREAFYNQNTWSEWITLLDSKNDIESQGNLKISGTGNHFIYNGNVGIGTINPQTKLHILADDKLGKTVGDYTPLTRVQGNAFENSILINDFILRESTGDNWQSASYIRGLSVDVSFLNPKTLRSWIKQNPVSERVEFGSSDNTFMSIGNNVGIGTINPQAKLDILKTATTNGNDVIACFQRTSSETGGSGIVRIGIHNTADLEINSGYSNAGHRFGSYFDFNIVNNKLGGDFGAINLATNGATRMVINPNGNIGIGTTTPNAKLDIQGKLHVGGEIYGSKVLTFQDDARFEVSSTAIPSLSNTSFSMPQYGIATPNTTGAADLWLAGYNAIRMFTAGNVNPVVNILYSGNVGIGTQNPDQKLTVKGKIHAEEIIVDLAVPADYVFKPNYKLMPLHQVEQFVKKNSHLPEIPSASEITKNGLSMGEMQNKLLQKVEELTLYAIQQNKEIVEQRKDRKELEVKLAKQESQYNALLEKVEMLTKQIENK